MADQSRDAGRVLRTIYIDPDIDDTLTHEALSGRVSKTDLINDYIRLGMKYARQQREQQKAAQATEPVPVSTPAKAKKASHADVLRKEYNAVLKTIDKIKAQREKDDAKLNDQLAKLKALLDDTE
jgi:seryl-tRNA synthetase